MEGLTLNIGWEYFLGILAALGAIVWYSGSRFSKIETDVQWLKDGIKDLKLSVETIGRPPLFQSQSPIRLTELGQQILAESGLKGHIDSDTEMFMTFCRGRGSLTNPYDVQTTVFDFFDNYTFYPVLEDQLKKYAYSKGMSLSSLKRIAAIYFRDICLEKLGMDPETIDNFIPTIDEG